MTKEASEIEDAAKEISTLQESQVLEASDPSVPSLLEEKCPNSVDKSKYFDSRAHQDGQLNSGGTGLAHQSGRTETYQVGLPHPAKVTPTWAQRLATGLV